MCTRLQLFMLKTNIFPVFPKLSKVKEVTNLLRFKAQEQKYMQQKSHCRLLSVLLRVCGFFLRLTWPQFSSECDHVTK